MIGNSAFKVYRGVAGACLLLLAAGAAAEAGACTRPMLIFHRAPFAVAGADSIIAEVEIYGARRAGGRIEARVRRMIRGPRRARLLLLRPYPTHICHAPPADGARGIIVARPAGHEGPVPVVVPVLR